MATPTAKRPLLDEQRAIAVSRFPCADDCHVPVGTACKSLTTGRAVKPHPGRVKRAIGWLARQPEVNGLNGTVAAAQAQVATLTAGLADLHGQLAVAEAELTVAEAGRATDRDTYRRQIADLKAQMLRLDPGHLPDWGLPAWRNEFDQGLAGLNVRTRANLGLGIDAGIPDASMVTVQDGILHIRSEWLPDAPRPRTPNPGSKVAILTHLTGYVDQLNRKPGDFLFAQRWGRWHWRAKTASGPNTRGALCALWIRNAKGGEIDVMEAWGYGGVMANAADYAAVKDTAKTTLFLDTMNVDSRIAQIRHREHGATFKPYEDFHDYDWIMLPDRAELLIDGQTVWTATPKSLPALWSDPMDSPWHVRMNTHVGPSAAYYGLPDPAHREWTSPLDFQVENVRVYAPPAAA